MPSLFMLGDKFPLKEEGLKGSGRVNCFLIFGEIDSDQVYAVQFLSVAQIPSLCSSSKLLSVAEYLLSEGNWVVVLFPCRLPL